MRIGTEGVDPRHRASLMGDVMALQLAGGEISVHGDSLACDWSLAMLGPGSVLGRGTQKGFKAARGGRLLGDGDADFSIFLADRGAAPFEQSDRRAIVMPGQAMLVAHARPVASIWEDTDFQVLRLPRAAFANPDRLDRAGGLTLDANSAPMRLLVAYTRALWPLAEAGDMPAIAARHLAELSSLAIDLAIGAAGADASRGPGVRAARLAAMHEVVARRFADPALTMARVAAAIGISARSGYLIFAQAEESFSDHLYGVRLERAYERLRSGYGGRLLDLALDVGFTDLSHFNHRFRARYGMSPGDARHG